LVSLLRALALLLARPRRGYGDNGSAFAVTETAHRALEIVYDSDALALSGVPTPLAEAVNAVLNNVGQVQLTRPIEA